MAVHDWQSRGAERGGQLRYARHDAAFGCLRRKRRRYGRRGVEDARLALADDQRGGLQPTRSHASPVVGDRANLTT
jgi:hypothetical protein